MSLKISNLDELKKIGNGLIVLNFWADWAPPCIELNGLFEKIASSSDKSKINFVNIEAEKAEQLSEFFQIAAVPTFIFLKEQKVIDKIEGANGADFANKLAKYSPDQGKENIRLRCERLVNSSPVILFMKGTADQPVCGFSRKMVDLLRSAGLQQFETFNILSDEEIRNGLKEYSNWPTYPQLYVEGKLIGGLDVTKALIDEGEFWNSVPKKYQTTNIPSQQQPQQPKESKEQLNQRLKGLIETANLMLFMKGNPEAPKCGFSSRVVERLNKNGLKFSSFDILTDESVRSGLKEYSNWPTFPQLYHKGKLVGGCDIVCEMDDSGQLSSLKE